jgi:hypothetical protein
MEVWGLAVVGFRFHFSLLYRCIGFLAVLRLVALPGARSIVQLCLFFASQ